VEIFKRGYDDAVAKGLRPRGIIIINPNNPIGDIYDESTIQPVLEFAAEKNLHVIIDEIYALSLFEDQKPFQSMLNYSSIIDPKRTHFVWSLSKDFALSGVRLGVVYAGSNELCSSANAINFIQIPSNIVQEIATTLISDHQWIDSYTKLNRSRLTQQYKKFKNIIESIDNRIYIRPAKAGFFIWADLRLLLHEITFEEEIRLFQSIFEHGLYLVTGRFLGCTQPGWFRIIFSIRETWIDEAIKRFELGLDAYQHSIVSSNE
jgi:aspartate/methionine/tyrosine aminotransferase